MMPGTDDAILEQAHRPGATIGVDSPIGWPDAFIDFVVAQRDGRIDEVLEPAASWRRSLSFRAGDEMVREVTGQIPLSVSTDRIGLVAMRCVALLARMDREGIAVHRDARPPLFEVYPAAALRAWNLPHRGYKASRDIRSHLIDLICEQLPSLQMPDAARILCLDVDHAFDALISALTTRAAALGAIHPAPEHLREQAAREGWIAVPSGLLGELFD